MLCKCLVFALVAVGFAAASGNPPRYTKITADREMLVKQKKIFDLLMYVEQNVFTDAEYFEIGRNYDIMANIDYYSNREAVMDFYMRYKLGFLRRDAIFTYYNQEQRDEMMLLYRLFYFAKDFNTFYKTACWARIHINPGMFVTAFTTAVIYRDDTKFIRLPAIYEIYPYGFFDSKVIREAQRFMMTRGRSSRGAEASDTSLETYYVYSNYSDMCISPGYEYEYRLSYFTEDVGLSAYYYYFRMMFPFWMNTKEYSEQLPKYFRGDLYYFFHQQLMARYYLERFSNGMGFIEDFAWDKMNLPGYYYNYVYANGLSMPRREWWNTVPFYKQRYLEYLKKLEIRIMEAIDSGYVYNEAGNQVNIMTPEGLNYLGNLIEGNYDSYNLKYYGSYDTLARDVLGIYYNEKNKNYFVPSSLQFFSTSLKDPAFYRLYDKIVQFFLRYKALYNRYTRSELDFPGVKIESVEVDKLVTYFDSKDYLINNAVDIPSFKAGYTFNIKTWQYRLNYKPFTYKFNVNSDKSAKAVVRIFLGPAYEGEKYDDYSYLLHYYKYFFMLDEFEVYLREGMNSFDRHSTDSYFFKKEYLNGDQFYKKIIQSMEGKEPFTYSDRMWGFPENLMLPKGSVDGMKFKMFFYIGPYEEGKSFELPFFGRRTYYGKSFGFPLDRPMYPWFFKLGNIYFKDVSIYNLYNEEMMSRYKYGYKLRDYGSMMPEYFYDYAKKDYYYKDSKDDSFYKSKQEDLSYDRMRDINMMHVF